MSSWDDYIKTLIASADCIKKGAILGTDGSVWAKSNGQIGEDFKLTAEETAAFAGLFTDLSKAPELGARLEGEKYIIPNVDENYVFGKKGKNGFWAAKTKQAILLAYFAGEGSEAVQCRKAVDHLVDYLSQQGY